MIKLDLSSAHVKAAKQHSVNTVGFTTARPLPDLSLAGYIHPALEINTK